MLPIPYYEEQECKIYHGDAIDILPNIRGDLILSDFPYAIGEKYDEYEDTNDNLKSLIDNLFPLMLKSAPVVMLSCGVGNMYKYPVPNWVLSWVTPAGAGSGPWGFCCWQPILVYGKDPYLRDGLGRRPDTYINTEISKINGHPCPKPISTWKWMLMRGSTKESDVIIDPLCGSGTTLIAARDLGHKSIGIEKSEKYCALAVERLRQRVLKFGNNSDISDGLFL